MNNFFRKKALLGGSLIIFLFTAACAHVVTEEEHKKAILHYDLGVTDLQAHHLTEALRELTIANQNDPNVADIHYALGLVYHAKQDTAKAEKHYKRALELRNNFGEARNNYATLLIDLGRYDEAIGELEKVINDVLYLTPALAMGNMGWAYHKKGDNTMSISYLQQATANDPNFCRGYLWLAQVFEDVDKIPQALHQMKLFYSRCMEKNDIRRTIDNSFVTQANKQMGLLLLKDGQDEEAGKYLEECAREEEASGVQFGICGQVLQKL